jgi:hypothetical protein
MKVGLTVDIPSHPQYLGGRGKDKKCFILRSFTQEDQGLILPEVKSMSLYTPQTTELEKPINSFQTNLFIKTSFNSTA